MDNHKEFGQDVYYGLNEEEAFLHAKEHFTDEKRERELRELLLRLDPKAEQKVSRAVNRWRSVVGKSLRTETGFRLSTKKKHRPVPVSEEGRIPIEFVKIIDHSDPDLFALYLILEQLKITADTLDLLLTSEQIRKALYKLEPKIGPLPENECSTTHDYIKDLLDNLDLGRIIRRFGDVDEDILGAYFFRVPKIELYWIVIGLNARILKVSIESLTVVVLIHELAHAYTHLGQDIDYETWDTDAFARTDIHVVEGLAQFYTQEVCRKHKVNHPHFLGAFESLLALQSSPYHAHEDWEQGKGDPGEIIRASMIRCRSKQEIYYNEFKNSMKNFRESLRNPKYK